MTGFRNILASSPRRHNDDKAIASLLTVCLTALLVVHHLQLPQAHMMFIAAYGLSFAAIAFSIMTRPYWAIIIIAAALPVSELFQNLTSQPVFLFSGIISLLAVSLFLHRASLLPAMKFTHIHLVGGLFLGWVFLSNPQAAMSTSGGYSIRHLIPLFILLASTSWLINSEDKERLLLRALLITSLISALYAIAQYDIGITSAESIRGRGLTQGPGTASLFFLISIIILIYDSHRRDSLFYRMGWLVPVAVFSAGIIATVSRTTILAVPLLLVLAYSTSALHTADRETLRRLQMTLWPMALLCIVQWDFLHVVVGIPFSIGNGGDSIGFRYIQWSNAWEIFLDHPIAGVGIGKFTEVLPYYGLTITPQYGLNYTPHSLYMGLLAENGLIGLLLFLTLVACALFEFWRHIRAGIVTSLSHNQALIMILLLFLFVGITGDMQFNKLFWLVIGLAASRRLHRVSNA